MLFLKKHKTVETKRIRDTKQKLKDEIIGEERLIKKLEDFDQEKKSSLRMLGDSAEFAKLDAKARKENEAYACAAKKISDRYAVQSSDLRARLNEAYEERRHNDLPDYQIFMAIADDIGYDATGRPTKTSELEFIGIKLREFISEIDEGNV